MQIGIFGGAFDPFHDEHRHIIEVAKKELGLAKIVVVPSYCPPHKGPDMSDYHIRRAMAEAGTRDLDYVIIDDIEFERNGINPTSVVLPLLKEKYPCDKLWFIMGGDSAINFHNWINPQKIADTAALAFCAREGCGDITDSLEDIRNRYGAEVRKLSYVGNWVSSSQIKVTHELDYPLKDVCKEVAAIIHEHRLYRKYGVFLDYYRMVMPEGIYGHCCRVAIFAAGLSGNLNLDIDSVFYAAMLHDCAKDMYVRIEGVPAPVVHQFVGAYIAKVKYGISDREIREAIKYHTTGKPDMTTLGKLIYCADMLEEKRDFSGVEELRELIKNDFEAGFCACVKSSLYHLKTENKPIHPLTEECYEYYNCN